MRRNLALLGMAGAIVVGACGRNVPAGVAERAIRRYNSVVVEAYRAADPDLVERVAGPEEAKRITGLIGVHLDRGRVLDAELVRLDVEGVRREPEGGLLVATAERWRYREVDVAKGVPVGEGSEDRYRMTYHLRKHDGSWIVESIRFAEPPQVGRRLAGWEDGGRIRHGEETR